MTVHNPKEHGAQDRSKPLVSVVMTVFNRENYVAAAAQSILNQSLRDLELIVVDDGSTDSSPQIVADIARQDPRVKIIRQENAGIAATRNRGAKEARGEYIAFQDDDDESLPQRIQKQADALDRDPGIAAVVCKINRIGESRKFLPPSPPPVQLPVPGTSLADRFLLLSQNMMIRRKVLLALGGFRPFFRISEDTDFTLRFAERYRATLLNDALYQYRVYNSGKGSNLENKTPLLRWRYYCAALLSAQRRRNGSTDPVANGATLDEIIPLCAELPADARLRCLKMARNAGRRLLKRGEGERMAELIALMRFLAADAPGRQAARRALRWLSWKAAFYGQWRHAAALLANNDFRYRF